MKLHGKKTYLASLAAILSAAGAYLAGDLALQDALQIAISAVLAATLRHGMATESK